MSAMKQLVNKCLNEFPRYDDQLPEIEGFYDSSWHNDACPSITKDLENDSYLILYCDYKNQSLSDWADIEDYKRYHLYHQNDETGFFDDLLRTNDLDEVKTFLTNYKGN
jgi:hypothetical protein